MKINSLRNTEGHFNSRRIRYILHNIYTIFAMNFLTSIMLKMKLLTAGTSLLRSWTVVVWCRFVFHSAACQLICIFDCYIELLRFGMKKKIAQVAGKILFVSFIIFNMLFPKTDNKWPLSRFYFIYFSCKSKNCGRSYLVVSKNQTSPKNYSQCLAGN